MGRLMHGMGPAQGVESGARERRCRRQELGPDGADTLLAAGQRFHVARLERMRPDHVDDDSHPRRSCEARAGSQAKTGTPARVHPTAHAGDRVAVAEHGEALDLPRVQMTEGEHSRRKFADVKTDHFGLISISEVALLEHAPN